MVVAGLLTDHKPKVEAPGFIASITRDIILGLVEIEESFLYHGRATMTQEKGFSWCPFSLLDGDVRTDSDRFWERLYVDEEGAVSGRWDYRILSKVDAENVQPYSFHLSVDWQIRATLKRWENCLLLRSTHRKNVQALLVVPLEVAECEIRDDRYPILDCHYVGTVYANLEFNNSVSVRLGKVSGSPTMSAAKLVEEYDWAKGPILFCPLWRKHLSSIRKARKQME
jgi:hypothetical protein